MSTSAGVQGPNNSGNNLSTSAGDPSPRQPVPAKAAYDALSAKVARVMALRRPDTVRLTTQRHVDYLTGWNDCLLSVRSLLSEPGDSADELSTGENDGTRT
jgi:hypothetical protein